MVSLVANGTAAIEIGRYGMTLDDAKAAFLETCEKHSVKVKNQRLDGKGRITIHLEFGNYDGLVKILYELAHVCDLHGDAPTLYKLIEITDVPPGNYIKTGSYND